MSVAPSASSLSCSCLQGCGMAQYGQALGCRLWAGCACTPREHTHRPEPAVAVGSRGEPQLPAISPQPPCAPALLCSSRAAPSRLAVASRGTAGSQARHTHTHIHTISSFRPAAAQVVQRMREAGEALRAQFELRRRRLALGFERDLGGGCRGGQGMQVSDGLVVWWSGGLVVWRLTSRSGVWFLVSGSPSALGRSIRAQPLGSKLGSET